MNETASDMISVIIPAYNHERFIGAAIAGVLNQTHGHLELIIVDDGSTDGTPEVIAKFHDPRIRAIRQPNQDAYTALNNGLKMARGNFIAILNSDDIHPADRLETLINVHDQTGAQCLFTDVRAVNAAGVPLPDSHPWLAWHERNRRFYFECGDLYTAFLHGNLMIGTSNIFIRTELARAVGNFAPLHYLHDYDYIFRVMLAAPGRVHYLHDRKLLDYRLHGGNTINQGAVIAREQDQELIRKYMLAGITDENRGRAETGANRLLELERELQIERRRMHGHWRHRIAQIPLVARRMAQKIIQRVVL